MKWLNGLFGRDAFVGTGKNFKIWEKHYFNGAGYSEFDSRFMKSTVFYLPNDTFNYILEENELRKLFAYLNKSTKAGGSFVFDISSEYKLSQIRGIMYLESFEDMAYLWENDYEPETKLLI